MKAECYGLQVLLFKIVMLLLIYLNIESPVECTAEFTAKIYYRMQSHNVMTYIYDLLKTTYDVLL